MNDACPTQPYAVDTRPGRPPEVSDPQPERKVKVGHLVVGLVFLGLAGAWALGSGGVLGSLAIGLVIPVVLVAAGGIGLLALVVGNRRRPAGGAGRGLETGPRPSTTDEHEGTDIPIDDNFDYDDNAQTDHDTKEQ